MMGRYIPPKCWFLEEPHGITSQKTAFFMFFSSKRYFIFLVTKLKFHCVVTETKGRRGHGSIVD
jgi:hypothetical protein